MNMLALKTVSFAEAGKWLENAIEAQRLQGKGQGTATVAPMVALKGIVAIDKDTLCPDTLFNLAKLRQTHTLQTNPVFPQGWLEPPPLPKQITGGMSPAIVPTNRIHS